MLHTRSEQRLVHRSMQLALRGTGLAAYSRRPQLVHINAYRTLPPPGIAPLAY